MLFELSTTANIKRVAEALQGKREADSNFFRLGLSVHLKAVWMVNKNSVAVIFVVENHRTISLRQRFKIPKLEFQLFVLALLSM